MPASVAMPAVRQNRSKLAPTCCQASSTIAAGKTPAGVVDLFMALLSFEDSAPRAYRLQVGNAYLTFSTSVGTSPTAVYYLPYLDSPALRKRKLQILIDDDGLPGGDTHHYQLTRAFLNIGAKSVLQDEEFADLEELCCHLDSETMHFVRLVRELYRRSLGPWCAVEVLSVDWLRALGDALSIHFSQFIHEPYFKECFSQRVEERHAEESLTVTQMVLRARPTLLPETLRHARMMAKALDGVWVHLDRIVLNAHRRARTADAPLAIDEPRSART